MSAQKPVDLDIMDGHTRGPWLLYKSRLRGVGTPIIHEVHSDYGVVVSWGGFDSLDSPKSRITKDARLIAAAPAMRAELVERRARDAAVERLVSAAERLAAAADDMALRKNDGGADPSICEVLEAVAAVRGGAE